MIDIPRDPEVYEGYLTMFDVFCSYLPAEHQNPFRRIGRRKDRIEQVALCCDTCWEAAYASGLLSFAV